jgi:hypothetical protein
VPAAKYEALQQQIAKLGELERYSKDSDDITDRYFDLEARIKNRKATEERLRQIYKEKANAVKEVLEIEKEVARIREDIEVQEGQLKRWANLVQMTTLTVQLRERGSYIPPETASFGTNVGRTFRGSLDTLVQFGKGLVLIVVALAPWLPILLLIALVGIWTLRRRRKLLPAEAVTESAAESAQPPPT